MRESIKKYLITILAIGGIIGILALFQANDIYSAGYGQSGKTSKYDIGDNTEKLSIADSATGVFTPAKLSTVNGDKTVRAVVQLEGADIRITWEGTTPSATVGLKITDGSWFHIVGETNITNFTAYTIAGAGTADLYIIYEKESEMNKTSF